MNKVKCYTVTLYTFILQVDQDLCVERDSGEDEDMPLVVAEQECVPTEAGLEPVVAEEVVAHIEEGVVANAGEDEAMQRVVAEQLCALAAVGLEPVGVKEVAVPIEECEGKRTI